MPSLVAFALSLGVIMNQYPGFYPVFLFDFKCWTVLWRRNERCSFLERCDLFSPVAPSVSLAICPDRFREIRCEVRLNPNFRDMQMCLLLKSSVRRRFPNEMGRIPKKHKMNV